MPSGNRAQFGIVAETVYGQAVTVNRFYPFVEESLSNEIERLESGGIIAGARVLRSDQWNPDVSRITGDIGLELFQQQSGLLFEHMLGSVTSSSAGGIATHTITPGSLDGKSLTMQFGRPDTTSTVQPFTYAGCKIQSWEIGIATGEIVTLGLTVAAKSETTGVSLATATYATDYRPFRYDQGGVTISATSFCVRALTITGENPMDTERRCIGSTNIDEPLENDLRSYGGVATLEFKDLTMYQRFLGTQEFPIVLSLSASATSQAIITMNARFDGATPNVTGRGLVLIETPFKCLASTSQDSSAISITLKNTQTSP